MSEMAPEELLDEPLAAELADPAVTTWDGEGGAVERAPAPSEEEDSA